MISFKQSFLAFWQESVKNILSSLEIAFGAMRQNVHIPHYVGLILKKQRLYYGRVYYYQYIEDNYTHNLIHKDNTEPNINTPIIGIMLGSSFVEENIADEYSLFKHIIEYFRFFHISSLEVVENKVLELTKAINGPFVLFISKLSQIPSKEELSNQLIDVDYYDHGDRLMELIIRLKKIAITKQICLIIFDNEELLGVKKSAQLERIFLTSK